MSVDASGPTAVVARMAAIQGQIVSLTGASTRAAATTAAGAATASVGTPSFESVIGSLQSAAGLGGGVGAGLGVGTAALAGLPTAATDLGARAVESARKYLGVPYVWGGESLDEGGLDCSGLVQRAYGDLGVPLARVAADQARQGTPVPSLAQARPGDLLAFNEPVTHIAIYVGDGKMIAAPKRGDVVKIQDVYETPTAIRRIASDAPVVGAAPSWGLPAVGAGVGATPVAGGSGPARFEALFEAATRRHGLPAGLLSAVARTESSYDPRAVSPAGAQGLMQLMPGTARGLGVDPFDPTQAVDGAARMLARDLRRFGSVELALAAYNAGAGAVQRYGGIPPYPETQRYVRTVLGHLGGTA